MLNDSPQTKIESILGELENALAGGDIDAAVNLFQDDCYWRDLVTFTWNIRTMEGKDQVRDMLKAQLASSSRAWAIGTGRMRRRPMASSRDGSLSRPTSRAALATCASRTAGSGPC